MEAPEAGELFHLGALVQCVDASRVERDVLRKCEEANSHALGAELSTATTGQLPLAAAPEVADSDSDFEVGVKTGDHVRLVGLVEAAHMNGMRGVCKAFNTETQRWSVLLDSGDEKNIKTHNLQQIGAQARVSPAQPTENSMPRKAKPGSNYHVNVGTLVPKSKQSLSACHTHPGSAVLVAEGELVSPRVNLLARAGRKRAAEDVPGEHRKVRRDDDTNDRVFQRRQELWTKVAREPVAALAPKSASGREATDHGKAEDGGTQAAQVVASRLQDDVQVAEGLRSPRWLWEALYPYQQTCVQWLWNLHCDKVGGILADEMGLGKTIQIVAYLATLHHSGVLPQMRVQNTSLGVAMPACAGGVLIVCPATLIHQWRSEFHLWYPPLRVCVMHQVDDRERQDAIRVASSQQGVLITSYETMRIANDDLLAAPWVMIILDEGQKIRNPHARVTIAAKRFSTRHRIILSGSPIQNCLQELWSLFDFVRPGVLGTLPVFSEELAQPIEQGSVMGASATRVAAAYECAKALRELTLPSILRRTKADVLDVLKLPHKQEQVLFCNLTPEQYQVYIEFLQSDQVRKARSASHDRGCTGAAFFAISVFRKICNHPDLLLARADPDQQPPDLYNIERSGKLKVLAEIVKMWHKEGHRCLIFSQTIQMLEVIHAWLVNNQYTHTCIDGRTPVKRRLKMIEEFNADEALFAMLLTTRVGGVGLNIIGANRVIIFDPDWNPMTDVQARERSWRIGQRRDVAVYRLILTGTIEEKIYQRQVYKHFLSQKVLNDARQRQFFKWNDMQDLFDVPPAPPGFHPKHGAKLRERYKTVFQKSDSKMIFDEEDVETTAVMKALSDLPTEREHVPSKDAAAEHQAILKSLYDSQGIKATFDHDKVEQPLLDRKIVRDGASAIAQRAVAAVRKSSRERASHHISVPTWTGQKGDAGGSHSLDCKTRAKREGVCKVKNEKGFDDAQMTYSKVKLQPSQDILHGLRQLAKVRNASSSGALPPAQTKISAQEDHFDVDLQDSDMRIAEIILNAFLDKSLAGLSHTLTTGQVLNVCRGVPSHHADLFKACLKQMCTFSKATRLNEPGLWTLREGFCPIKR